MNATRDSIDPAMRAAAEDVCADFPDVVPIDTRLLMGFFTSLRSMLVECGVHDFSFGDLVRPTHERLVKIFSYIINFVRFRESQTSTIDANFNKAESTKNRIETLYMENQEMEQRLEDMRRNRKAMEAAVKEKQKRNDEIKARLIELRKGQDRLQDHLQRAKASKESSGTMLEEKTERLMRTRQECEKLKPYVTQSPAALQGSLTELSDNLAKVRGQNDALERRSRALQTSTDSFSVVHTDVASCIKVLDEIQVELQKEDEEDLKASKNKDSLSDYRRSVEDKERDEQVLMKTLRRWEERTDELKQKHRDRDIANKKKMEELRTLQKEIKEERAEKGRDMERKKIRVEQTEKKVSRMGRFVVRSKADLIIDGRSERRNRARSQHHARRILQA